MHLLTYQVNIKLTDVRRQTVGSTTRYRARAILGEKGRIIMMMIENDVIKAYLEY